MGTSTACITSFAAGLGAAALYLYLKRRLAAASKVTVTYFDIKATPGEKLRLALALSVGKDGFTDERIPGKDWATVREQRKPKYGQMPIVSLDGTSHYQSGALLRYIGSTLGDGSLYPVSDPAACLKIEEALGLADDLQRAWTPGLYMGMRPAYLGYPADMGKEDKDAKVKALREDFLKNEFPKYMGWIERELEQTGAFIAGKVISIADCQLYPQLDYFRRGVADHVPADCLDKYCAIIAYLDRVKAVPAIKEWYA